MARLLTGEVHIWRVDLDCEAEVLRSLEAVLPPEERDRAARFKFDHLQRRWTAAHGALRIILADYVDAAPDELVFEEGAQGKPTLAGSSPAVEFNLSHSGSIALVAIASEGSVGVDVEIVRPNIDYLELSRRFFAPAEADEIEALPPDQRVAAFFACWTRKEAFVKALGTGLSTALDRFRVTVRAESAAEVVWVEEGLEVREHWSLVDLSEPGAAAAVAVRQPSAIVRCFRFAPPSR